LQAGDVITVDGSTGDVFEGTIPGTTEVVPEALTLLAWARELGIPIGDAGDGTGSVAGAPDAAGAGIPDGSGSASGSRHVGPDDCLRAIAIKGFAPAQGVADATLSTLEVVQPIVDQLALDGSISTVAGSFRLTETGTARAAALLAAEQAAWGLDHANAALDAFLGLDHRMKDTVTAWQIRDPRAQLLNDHADADYDQVVLDQLAALHADAIAWLTPLESACPRLGTYGVRLGRALDNALRGDERFVASPRVDSYHGVWFELHEDLIQLAGRNRADEVAAGRA